MVKLIDQIDTQILRDESKAEWSSNRTPANYFSGAILFSAYSYAGPSGVLAKFSGV